MTPKTGIRKKVSQTALSSASSTQAEKMNLEMLINQMLLRKDFDSACRFVQQYLDKYEKETSYEQLCVMANSLCLNMRLQESFEIVMKALHRNGDRPEAPEILFWIYQNKGDKQGLTVINRLIEDGPVENQQKYLYWKALYANNHSDHEMVLNSIQEAGGAPEETFEKYSEVMFSYITALIGKGELAEAEASYEAIPPKMRYVNHYILMALAGLRLHQGRGEEVVAVYDELLEKFPDVIEARWNRALANLSIGRLAEGWIDYERRWEWKGFPSPEKLMSVPRWNGETLEGKSILFWSEQGMGDQLMFLSLLAPIAVTPNVKIRIEVNAKLIDLVSAWYPGAQVGEFIPGDCRDDSNYRDLDYHLPQGSLPPLMLPDQTLVKNRPMRFMTIRTDLREQIVSAVGIDGPTLVVGLSWRSSFLHKSRNSQYLSVQAVKAIVNQAPPNTVFVSLQYNLSDEERVILEELDRLIVPEVEFFDDVLSHLKYIGQCDYIITAPTLVRQLAGLANIPCLSWGVGGWSFLGQRQYPWFPSVAVIEANFNHDKGTLVHRLSKWLNIALEHHDD